MITSWHIWLIVALALLIIEILTSGFAAICFSIGAFCSALTAYLGCSLTVQLSVFAAISLLCAFAVRPLFIKFLSNKGKDSETNAQSMIGRTAIVTEDVDKNTGRVSIYGESWQAVSATDDIIPKGEKVIITKIDSLILTVKKS